MLNTPPQVVAWNSAMPKLQDNWWNAAGWRAIVMVLAGWNALRM